MPPRVKNSSKAAGQAASCSFDTPLSTWTKADLLHKLRGSPCPAPIPPKAGLDKLRQMVVDQGLHDAEMIDVKHFSIVKCALRKAMLRGRRDVFSRTFHDLFSDHVEQLVAGISKRLRLASLGLAAHVTELLNDGLYPPDLFQQKDTYWKNWLRFGAGGDADFPAASWPDDSVRLVMKLNKSDGSVAVEIKVPSCTELYRPLVRVKLQTTADGTLALAIGLTDVNGQAKAIIHEMQPPVTLRLAIGTGTEEEGPVRVHITAALPPVLGPQGDQVLNYAARTLETVVCNNAWVPLWARLQRLAKSMLRPWKEGWRRSVDSSVRHAAGTEGVSAPKLLHAIRRPAARADDFPEPARSWIEAVRDHLRRPEDDDRWLADDHGSKLTFGTIMSFNYWMQLCFREQGVRCMRLMPVIGVGRKHVRLDERTLSAVLGKVYKQTVDTLWPQAQRDKNGKVIHFGPIVSTAGLDSKAEEACAVAHKALTVDDMMAFLPGAPRTKRSAGLVFKASLMTDGVSVSLAYTKTTQRVKRYWQAPTSKAAKKPLADLTDEADDEVSTKTYDKSLLSTLALEDETVIVLGVDPGRVKIVSVAWLYDESTTIKWTLSGGQYHSESRLRSLTKEKEKRYRQLAPLFQSLAGHGSSTTTPWATEVKEYARRCAASWNEWWDVALRRRESRSALASYMGKARVMDGFYSRVLKDVSQAIGWMEEDVKPVRIEFAYGSAGPTMKASGRGELAVPTTTAFKRCQAVTKAFTDCKDKRRIKYGQTRRVEASVQLVDEFRTSAYCWETGQRNGKVYRIIDEEGKVSGLQCLGPDGDRPPVPEAKRAGVKLWLERAAYRSKMRRGGRGESSEKSVPEADRRRGKERGNTYPEIRGLRFCTERRKFFGRDVSAAETIARLRVLELKGEARPQPFSRP